MSCLPSVPCHQATLQSPTPLSLVDQVAQAWATRNHGMTDSDGAEEPIEQVEQLHGVVEASTLPASVATMPYCKEKTEAHWNSRAIPARVRKQLAHPNTSTQDLLSYIDALDMHPTATKQEWALIADAHHRIIADRADNQESFERHRQLAVQASLSAGSPLATEKDAQWRLVKLLLWENEAQICWQVAKDILDAHPTHHEWFNEAWCRRFWTYPLEGSVNLATNAELVLMQSFSDRNNLSDASRQHLYGLKEQLELISEDKTSLQVLRFMLVMRCQDLEIGAKHTISLDTAPAWVCCLHAIQQCNEPAPKLQDLVRKIMFTCRDRDLLASGLLSCSFYSSLWNLQWAISSARKGDENAEGRLAPAVKRLAVDLQHWQNHAGWPSSVMAINCLRGLTCPNMVVPGLAAHYRGVVDSIRSSCASVRHLLSSDALQAELKQLKEFATWLMRQGQVTARRHRADFSWLGPEDS
eukprot:m.180116 g.180116  ORF g.180116 m.180116 type:complete len:469 (+) comp18006_c0_seq3:108-1514(+)